MLRIKLIKSIIGHTKKNRAVVQSLGLRKVRQVVEHEDCPSIRGMIHRVKNLLEVEEFTPEAAAPVKAKPSKAKAEAAPVEASAEEAKPTKARSKKAAEPAAVSE